MGQRPTGSSQRSDSQTAGQKSERLQLAIFATQLGWFGLAGSGKTVVGLTIGHASAVEVRSAISDRLRTSRENDPLVERDWYPELRRALEQYAQGRAVDLRPFEIELGQTTPYRKRVLEAARRIPYGKTATYGDLAIRSGKPRAARAVGSAMASNPIALLIPCHRVVAAGGIGGFSCRTGVELKQRLLELEACGVRGKTRSTR